MFLLFLLNLIFDLLVIQLIRAFTAHVDFHQCLLLLGLPIYILWVGHVDFIGVQRVSVSGCLVAVLVATDLLALAWENVSLEAPSKTDTINWKINKGCGYFPVLYIVRSQMAYSLNSLVWEEGGGISREDFTSSIKGYFDITLLIIN